MDAQEYQQWKAREADYRKARRKRSYMKGKKKVAYFWDQTDPPIKYENLIDRWQDAILRCLTLAEEGLGLWDAWKQAAPSSATRALDDLDPPFKRSLEEVYDAWLTESTQTP